MYHSYYKMLIDSEESPYREFSENKQAQVSYDEFLWAFSTISSRHLVLGNECVTHMHDPNAVLMIVPLLDFINHDPVPNVIALPYHDKVNDMSYVILNAIRDIAPGE